ncbi:MAG: tetratricopeptide repeat protein [Oligoflexia bacterium]|nr:tetratricopeptide repeat protein [Oligoflexia bacterium]
MSAAFIGLLVLSSVTPGVVTAQAYAEESHPGLMAEALYSEALIAFHRQQIDQAVKILDGLLATSPDYAEALELRALILRGKGSDAEAAQAYEKLLTIRPPEKQAPYHYELGMIYYRQKKEADAQAHFERALKAGFNSTVCRFFLGMIAFGRTNDYYAEYYFRKVAAKDNGELKLLSLYYLGLIEVRASTPLVAVQDLTAAQKLAKELPQTDTTKQIASSVTDVLAPFTQSQIFANAAFLGQYNSNISQVPTSLTSSSQSVSNQATGVLNVSGGVGYMTAPLSDFQFVGSYHFSLNMDTNSGTKNYQFVTNTASFYFNYQPLAKTQAGFKVDGNFMFQDNPTNSADPSSSSYQYSKYLLGGEIGPYFRYQIVPQVQTELDLYVRPQTYYTQPELSGVNVFTRFSAKADLLNDYFNPSAFVEFENDSTSSTDFKAHTYGVGIADAMKITARDFLTPGLDFLESNYPQSSVGRRDSILVAHIVGYHVMNPHFSILGNISYTKDNSTESDVYSYTQTVVSLGVSYSL